MRTCSFLFWRAVAVATACAVAYAQMPSPRVVLLPQPGVPQQDADVGIGLHIVVLGGQNAINVVKKRAAVKPLVEIRDRTNSPVEGAWVTFTTPNDNPSAVFSNGSRSETLVTNRTGQATVASMRPEGAGAFQLRVTASFHGDTTAVNIFQTNVLSAADAAHVGAHGEIATTATSGLSNKTVIGIVAGVAAAAAVGIGVGLANGKSASSSSTVGVGTPTVGAPH